MTATDAFWLPPLEEAFQQSNEARPGDPDYKSPLPKKKKPKRPARSGTVKDDKGRARGLGDQGGQFVKKAGSGDGAEEEDAAAVLLGNANKVGLSATIRAFQRKHGLKVDGVIGEQTALALQGRYSTARRTTPGAMSDRTARTLRRRVPRRTPSTAATRRTPRTSRSRGGAVAEGVDDQPRAPKGTGKGGQWVKGGAPLSGGDAAVIPKIDWALIDPKSFKAAGGSTGAKFGRLKTGEKILVKRYGGNERRVATELTANALYRHAGLAAPRMGYTRGPDGKRAVAYELVPGEVRKGWARKGPSADLSKGFVMDAFLGNWDVVGLEDDNTLWDQNGRPVRIDHGGSLEFRAMGSHKKFGPVPDWGMLDRSQVKRAMTGLDDLELRRQSSAYGALLTDGVIDQIVDAARFPSASQAARVKTNLKARARWLREYGEGKRSLPARVAEAEEPLWLAEMAIPGFAWDETAHPRDNHGKFTERIDKLSFGAGVSIDAKTYIKRDKDGTYRVVRSGQIIKGFSTPADAARAALDRSVKGKDADSVGGTNSYKNYNEYLKARGVQGVEKPLGDKPSHADFGGKKLNKAALFEEAARLSMDIKAAQESGDKYRERTVATLTARKQEALTKAGLLGATTAPAPPVPSGSAQEINTLSAVLAQSSPGQTITHVNGTAKKFVGGIGTSQYQVKLKGADFGTTQTYKTSLEAAKALAAGKHLETSVPKVPETKIAFAQKIAKAPLNTWIEHPNGKVGKFEKGGEVKYQVELKGELGSQVYDGPLKATKALWGDSDSFSAPPAPPASPPASSAPKTIAEFKAKHGDTFSSADATPIQLGAGDIIQTPSGKLLVKSADQASVTTGYVKTVNLESGATVEVPASKNVAAWTATPAARLDAKKMLALKQGGQTAAQVAKPKPKPAPPLAPSHPGATWEKDLLSASALADALTAQQKGAASKLSSDSTSAITEYTASGYGAMNSQLRAKEPIGIEYVEEKINAMDKAFKEMPGLAQDSLLWRGVNGKTGDAYRDKAQVGSIIRDHGYTSMSTSKVFAQDWGTTLLKVRMPKGSKGLWVSAPGDANLSSQGQAEREFIVPHGMVMKVVHREKTSTGKVVLTCEVIGGNVL